MKKTRKTLLKTIVGGILSLILCFSSVVGAFADGRFSVSPMNQKIVLTPGETYNGSFRIVNPGSNTTDFKYKAEVTPFYVDEDYHVIYENNGDYTQMVNWMTIDNKEGTIAPNNVVELHFSIDVPKNAPAGGQYAAITVSSDNNGEALQDGLNIDRTYSIAHIIYAEIAGTTRRGGEIFNANVQGFILDGDISGVSSIRNDGNVHGTAKYTLQIWPLFSGEEVYTNEESPMEKTVLPGRTLTSSIAWEGTPIVGIFNVKYTVDFEGVTTEVSKMVIKCPVWLLLIIIIIIVGIVVWIVFRSKSRKKTEKKSVA